MPQHTVTAIIPTYNCAHLLGRAIESVLAQTRTVNEVIVVDDGSKDGTRDVVAGFGKRVRYIFQENRGVAATRNLGVAKAESEWVAFLDQDDEWISSKIERQCEALQSHADSVLCYSSYWLVDFNGTVMVKRCTPVESLWPNIRLRNPFLPSVVMVRKSAFQQLGGFSERLRGASCEDWELFIRMAAQFKLVSLDEPLMRCYEVPGSASLDERKIVPATLSIVDSSLLMNLSGWRRTLWRQRIRAMIYYRGAISARLAKRPSVRLLAKSFLNWPSPMLEPRRMRTVAATLLGR